MNIIDFGLEKFPESLIPNMVRFWIRPHSRLWDWNLFQDRKKTISRERIRKFHIKKLKKKCFVIISEVRFRSPFFKTVKFPRKWQKFLLSLKRIGKWGSFCSEECSEFHSGETSRPDQNFFNSKSEIPSYFPGKAYSFFFILRVKENNSAFFRKIVYLES